LRTALRVTREVQSRESVALYLHALPVGEPLEVKAF
jgi:hypothetical protein